MIFGLSKKTMKILKYGTPTLKEKSQPVHEINHDIFLLGQRMLDTMAAADGLGLAGPQVGVNKRIIALSIPSMKNSDNLLLSPGENQLLPLMPLVLINPEIISFGNNLVTNEEGCLSIPDIYAPVTRPETVVLRAQILGGELIMAECGGLLARALQHELDHLDGTLFTDRLEKDDLVKISNKLERLKKAKKFHH